MHGRACVPTQPTSPARPGTVWVRAPHGPTLNSPQLVPTVSMGLPLHPYSPPCDFKQPGLSQCCSSLAWQGREYYLDSLPGVLRQAQQARAWGCSHPCPCAGPRDIFVLKQSCFFSVLYTFWSPIFINAGVLLAVCFVPQIG